MPEGFSDLEARLTETARASLQRAGLLAHNTLAQSMYCWEYWRRIHRWERRFWLRMA